MDIISILLIIVVIILLIIGKKIPDIIGISKNKSKNQNNVNDIKSTSQYSNNDMFNETEFINGILNSRVTPSRIEKHRDKEGEPYQNFDFPDFKCQIHVHFKDEQLEQISFGKIKIYNKKEEIFIANEKIAMLRHLTKEYSIIDKTK